MRVVPDVAALGDPNTGMLVGETQQFPDGTYYDEYRIGGTSLSSPLYAGMFALAVQKAGHSFGLANPALYAHVRPSSLDITKAQLDAYPGDVRSDYVNGVDAADGYVYSARWFDRDEDLTIHVRPGYDDVTGIGVPTATLDQRLGRPGGGLPPRSNLCWAAEPCDSSHGRPTQPSRRAPVPRTPVLSQVRSMP